MEKTKRFFATPQDAETAFYEALEQANLEAMMSVWAEDEEVICVHPGGVRLAGYAEVMEGWRQMFAQGTRLQIALSNPVHVQGLLISVHSVHEHVVVVGEDVRTPPVVATNIYLRGAEGWRMLAHHASPVSTSVPLTVETPKTLH
ncbi:MAG: nuclear transport factor 2 family protein [Betaproteobacteria bacterium]|nr:nuclear transport factor 2 family protein [Betaproteobacteria bacterium]